MAVSSKTIRKEYIEFFEKNAHQEVQSSSLVPHENDQTVLFTTAGMQQFVPNLMGTPHPFGTRLCSVQKCVRTVDIDEVGDNRHLTFFEMLGNWSLGDYFKKESLTWSFQFLTEKLGIPQSRIWVTVFGGDKDVPLDEDSTQIWKELGFPSNRIIPISPQEGSKKGRGDNFWGPAGPTGPCGPCSEMHIWIGEGEPREGQNPATDDTNFIEVWNDVFMEFYSDENGKLSPLKAKNVDTGMGLERITMVVNGLKTVFETDVYAEIFAKIEFLSHKKYPPYSGDTNPENPTTRAMRVIADHARAASHLIADGVAPSNEGRGYVLRRLVRRAVRFGKQLGFSAPFLGEIASAYITAYAEFYPELESRKRLILDTLQLEEEKFFLTLERGESILTSYLLELSGESSILSGEKAFSLFDTYGFPLDLTKEIAAEQGFSVDIEGFEKEMGAQRARSREGTQDFFDRKGEDMSIFEALPKTAFVGYESFSCEATILAVQQKEEGKVLIALDSTPFYAESGGQIGDKGSIVSKNGKIRVHDTKKVGNGVFVHFGELLSGSFSVGEKGKAEIAKPLRERIKRHHSATHLLHSALKKVLGKHVEQAGSLVTAEKTRFDFSHPKAMTKEEIRRVEGIIAEWVTLSLPVVMQEMELEKAKQAGAEALFSEKYESMVRTIRMGEASFELCGGTHIANTAEIGAVKILSESSVASGIRRIEMVCGPAAQELLYGKCDMILEIAQKLKSPEEDILDKISSLFAERKEIEEALNTCREELFLHKAEEILYLAEEVQGKRVLCCPLPTNDLKELGSIAKSAIQKGVSIVCLFAEDGGVVVASSEKAISAKEVLNKIFEQFGGRGGGSPAFAQGSAVNIESFQEIKAMVADLLKK